MRVKRWNPLRYTPGKHYRLVTPFSSRVLIPFSKSVVNVVSGLKERVYYLNPDGDQKPPCQRNGADFAPLVSRLVSEIGNCNRLTGDEFIISRNGSKRLLYTLARTRLGTEPATLAQLAQLGFFTKYENTVWDKQQVLGSFHHVILGLTTSWAGTHPPSSTPCLVRLPSWSAAIMSLPKA